MPSPMVSIVIPVYNAIDYLGETLKTVFAQQYENYEILLVDDGSSDGSNVLCDLAKKQDSRVRVFHIKNCGVATARNYALDRISGEYVLFVDADDLIKPEYVKQMVSVAISTSSPIVTCKHMSGKQYTCEDFYKYTPSISPRITELELAQYRCTGKYRHDEICSVMFAVDIINEIRFEVDLYIGEDTLFFAQALYNAGRFVFVDEMYYYYRFHENSAIHSVYQKRHETEIISRERVCELFSNQSNSFRNECETALAVRCMNNYRRAKTANYSNKLFLREICGKARNRIKNVLCSTGYSKKFKLHFLFFCFFPNTYVKYINLRENGKMIAS